MDLFADNPFNWRVMLRKNRGLLLVSVATTPQEHVRVQPDRRHRRRRVLPICLQFDAHKCKDERMQHPGNIP